MSMSHVDNIANIHVHVSVLPEKKICQRYMFNDVGDMGIHVSVLHCMWQKMSM